MGKQRLQNGVSALKQAQEANQLQPRDRSWNRIQKAGHKEGDARYTGDQGFADLDPVADFFIEQNHPRPKQPGGHWPSGKKETNSCLASPQKAFVINFLFVILHHCVSIEKHLKANDTVKI